MNTSSKAISYLKDNPFRALGCFANDTKKTIEGNKSRIRQYSAVGKKIQFPSDFCSILGEVDHSEDAVSKAESLLTLSKDRIRYTQFWFVKLTPLDEIAFTRLDAGLINSAINIWSKKDYFASLHNKTIAYLIHGDFAEAIDCAQLTYSTFLEKYTSLLGEEVAPSEEILAKNFIDLCLAEFDVDPSIFRSTYCNKIWRDYVEKKEVDILYEALKKSIDKVSSRNLSTAKDIVIIANGDSFISDVDPKLIQLKTIEGENSPRYNLISDDAAKSLYDLSNRLMANKNVAISSFYGNSISASVKVATVKRYLQKALEWAYDNTLRENIRNAIEEAAASNTIEEANSIEKIAERYIDKGIQDGAIFFWNEALPIVQRVRENLPVGDKGRSKIVRMFVLIANRLSVEEINKTQQYIDSLVKKNDFATLAGLFNEYRSKFKRHRGMLINALHMSEDLTPEIKKQLESNIGVLDSFEKTFSDAERRVNTRSPASDSGCSGVIFETFGRFINIIIALFVLVIVAKACGG